MVKISEEIKTLITMLRHRIAVQRNLRRISQQIEARIIEHDSSKFQEDEFEGFVEINVVARVHPYGSEEYKNSISHNKAVELHWSRNRHHPEYNRDIGKGVEAMTLVDMIELVCDWKAASETYGQTSFQESLAIQSKRFNLTPEQEYVIGLIARSIL